MEGFSNISFGELSSAPNNAIVETIHSYVVHRLMWFEGGVDENEDTLTARLCQDLDYYKEPEHFFSFHHQNYEGKKSKASTDFAAYPTAGYPIPHDRTAFVKFEAKRLSSHLPKAREKEYAIGQYTGKGQVKNSGAIERFKNETHGSDVSHACLIGYVQTESINVWEKKMNGWIEEEIASSSDIRLKWNKYDLLGDKEVIINVATFRSICARISHSSLNVRHIWKDLTDKKKA